MSRTPSPSLAFYLKHPTDCDALWELDGAPDKVSEDDWRKFGAVQAKAAEQAAELLIACRDQAMQPFSARYTLGYRQPTKAVLREWYAFGELVGKKAKAIKAFYVGCSLGPDPDGAPFLYPYIAPARVSARAELLARLKETRPEAPYGRVARAR